MPAMRGIELVGNQTNFGKMILATRFALVSRWIRQSLKFLYSIGYFEGDSTLKSVARLPVLY